MMASLRNRLPKHTLLYLLYALLLTAALLYLRFPAEQFRSYCMKRVERFLPGTECTLGPMQYVVPFSLRIDGAGLAKTGRGETNFLVLEQLTLTPVWRHPLSQFNFSGTAYTGSYRGRITIDSEAKNFSIASLQINGFDLAAMTYLQEKSGREISGTLELDGSYSGPADQPLSGRGRGQVTIEEGSVELSQQILGLAALAIEHGGAQWNYTPLNLQLSGGKLQSDEIVADFTGTVQLKDPWYFGEVAVRGTLRPQPAFLRSMPEVQQAVSRLQRQYGAQTLPFQMNGTLAKPTFAFGSPEQQVQ